MLEVDIVAGEEPVDGGGGGGIVVRVLAEAVYIFGGSDKVTEFVSFRFICKRELEDDGINIFVVVRANNLFSERV